MQNEAMKNTPDDPFPDPDTCYDNFMDTGQNQEQSG
jgi:hypothetical protein